jgi:hypothetical protein
MSCLSGASLLCDVTADLHFRSDTTVQRLGVLFHMQQVLGSKHTYGAKVVTELFIALKNYIGSFGL